MSWFFIRNPKTFSTSKVVLDIYKKSKYNITTFEIALKFKSILMKLNYKYDPYSLMKVNIIKPHEFMKIEMTNLETIYN